jgi:3'-5' exoribonuclease
LRQKISRVAGKNLSLKADPKPVAGVGSEGEGSREFGRSDFMPPQRRITALANLEPGQEGEFFAILMAKEELKTREGKPYYRVTFRDARRQVSFPIWSDSRWGPDCRNRWVAGRCYRMRAVYRETSYGPELDIREIRDYLPDRDKDFVPEWVHPCSREAPTQLFDRLRTLVETELVDPQLKALVLYLLDGNRHRWCQTPGSARHQFSYVGGLLEHTLRVAENALFLAKRYWERYADPRPGFDPDLVLAGAVLHDIGKLVELEGVFPGESESDVGGLIGHLVLGRDLLRAAVAECPIPAEKLLRLEHILLSHHGQPEWGSPKPPMTLEALLVHYANEVDVRFELVWRILNEAGGDGVWTSDRNPFKQRFYRGREAGEEPEQADSTP